MSSGEKTDDQFWDQEPEQHLGCVPTTLRLGLRPHFPSSFKRQSSFLQEESGRLPHRAGFSFFDVLIKAYVIYASK